MQQYGLWFCYSCQQYFQPIQQPPQQIQPTPYYYQQTTLPQQHVPPRGKSKAPLIAAVIIIVALVFIATIFFWIIPPEDEDKTLEMSMAEFVDDYEDLNGDGSPDNFRSFDNGDKVRISDVVAEIEYYEFSDITIIKCESTENYDWTFPILLEGDQTHDYDIGDTITVTWHIKRYIMDGFSVEFPEELYGYGTLTVTPITPTVSMNWNEDPEEPGNYVGNVVSISGTSSINTDDVVIVLTHGTTSDSKDLDTFGTLVVGTLTLSFNDLDPVGKLGAEDIFSIVGDQSGDVIRLVYKPTSGQMCSSTLY